MSYAYAVYDPDGKILFPTLDESYALAMAGAEGMVGDDWPSLKRRGYQCLRVEIKPIPRTSTTQSPSRPQSSSNQ